MTLKPGPDYGGGDGKSVFYLYYESNNNRTLQIANFPKENTYGPWISSYADLALSRIVYAQAGEIVSNS